MDGVPGAIHASYATRQEAYKAFTDAQEAGIVRILTPDGPKPSRSTNRYSVPAEETVSAPPRAMTPVKLEEFDEVATRLGGMSISSAPPYRSSWNPSSARTVKQERQETPPRQAERRFPAPQPLTQHRSLPSTTTASLDGSESLLMQRAHSEGYQGSTKGSISQGPRITVGSAPHLSGYAPRRQRTSTPLREGVLSPLVGSEVASLSSIGSPRIRAPSPIESPSRSSSRASPGRVDTPPMVTAAQSPASDKGKKVSESVKGSPIPFDIRGGTSTFNGSNRTPRTPKRDLLMSPGQASDLGLAQNHVPFRFYQAEDDIRSLLNGTTPVPRSMQ